MRPRLRTAPGVIWWPLEGSQFVAVSPMRRSPEGLILLSRDEAGLLERLCGKEGRDVSDFTEKERELLERWAGPEFGLVEEVPEPRERRGHEEVALGIFREYSSAKEVSGSHDLSSYHTDGIRDAMRQFEEVEMTVSHLFREPHPVLGGLSYGAAFARALMERGALFPGARVLEVGCGTGIFGRELLGEVKRSAPEIYSEVSYTFFDLSPTLSDSQRKVNKEHEAAASFEAGDVLSHPFPEGGFDLVISNEMIADLPVTKLKKGEEPADGPEGEALGLAGSLGIDLSDAPPEFLLNVGAFRFLKRLTEILGPSGRAFVVEYGSPWAYPAGQMVTDHVEYSIHFGHLEKAALSLGLGPVLTGLVEFLGFREDIEVLGDLCHSALFCHLLPFLGMKGEASKVYTKEMFEDALPDVAERARNLEFVPAKELGGIVFPGGFYVLDIKRSATATPRGA